MHHHLLLLQQLFLNGGGAATDAIPEPEHVFISEPPLFCDPIYSDVYKGTVPTWYSGGWRAKLPLSNVATDDINQQARSLDLNLGNTLLRVDLRKARTIKAVVVPKSNLSRHAQYRVTLAATDSDLSGSPAYQSAWLPTRPAWVTDEVAYGRPVPIVHFVTENMAGVSARFCMIEFSDASNPNGYIDLYRVLFAGVYVFPRNMSVGASMGMRSQTETWTSDGGSKQFNVLPKARTASFEIGRLEEAEAFGVLEEMQERLGIDGQVYYCFGQHDPLMWKRSFLATMTELGAADWAWSTALKKRFVLEECL